jgi:poly(3-hydroxybutyrate) depolymerase
MNPKKILVGVIAVALLCGFFAAVAHRVRAFSANSNSLTMEFGGRTRRYILHIPACHDFAKPAPLVMILHGAMQSPESKARMTSSAFLLIAFPSWSFTALPTISCPSMAAALRLNSSFAIARCRIIRSPK